MSPDTPAMTDGELADAQSARDLLATMSVNGHHDRSSIYGEQCSCGSNDWPCPDGAKLWTAASFMTALLTEVKRLREREVAYRALAEEHQKRGDKLSAQLAEIGDTSVQWGVRYTAGVDGTGADCSQEEDPIDWCDDQADATRLAAHTPGAIPVWHVRGKWREVGS